MRFLQFFSPAAGLEAFLSCEFRFMRSVFQLLRTWLVTLYALVRKSLEYRKESLIWILIHVPLWFWSSCNNWRLPSWVWIFSESKSKILRGAAPPIRTPIKTLMVAPNSCTVSTLGLDSVYELCAKHILQKMYPLSRSREIRCSYRQRRPAGCRWELQILS